MEIKKYKNDSDSYDFELISGKKILRIFFGGTLDLYLSLSDGRKFDDSKNVSASFDITKEDYEIFILFDKLYNDIISGNVFGKRNVGKEIDDSIVNQYREVVDKNNDINWISDDGPRDIEDRFKLSQIDKDTYRITFYRNDKPKDFGFKSSSSISIRIRNSGSYYAPFNCIFMRMFNALQEINPDYHQIHIEEYQYQKRRKQASQ